MSTKKHKMEYRHSIDNAQMKDKNKTMTIAQENSDEMY